MFHYINQPGMPSFPTGLVKIQKWIWIIITVETDLEKRILVVAVIIVDAYPFWGFLALTGHFENTGMCFLVALCHLIVKRPSLEIGAKRTLHQ